MRFLVYPIILFLMLAIRSEAQDGSCIRGKICDESNGNPLPFTQIALGRSSMGTVSNEEGYFLLQVPSAFAGDTLYVSYLGYEQAKLSIKELEGRENVIRLKPKVVTLREVEVVALTPQEVMMRAYDSISSNYGADTVLLTAFYRSQKFTGKKMAEYAEAVIEDLKTGYSTQFAKRELNESKANSNITRLVKGRVVSDTNLVNAMGDVGKTAGCLGCVFMIDPVEMNFGSVLDPRTFLTYSLKMKELSNPEGGKIYHISFDQVKKNQRGFRGELFIDGSTFAVMKITQKPSFNAFDQYEKDKYKKVYTINETPGWVAEMPLLDRTVTYSKRGGKWYLNVVRDEQWVTFTQMSSRQQVRMGYRNDLVVTEVTRDPVQIRQFKGDRKTGVGKRWDQLTGRVDEDFWATFNYLPVEEKLKSEILQIKK